MMTFEDLFLRSQNQDCLGEILSFLACNDLANTARACKVLQKTIFGADNEDDNVNLIWQGAEEALTKPLDRQTNAQKRIRKVGSNAREYCHLFALASKAAKECELSDEVEENRIKVDGVLADLLNVRGFEDAEIIAEKKAIGERVTRTPEEATLRLEIRPMNSLSDEEREERSQRAREHREKWEKLRELKEPTKTYHHAIFVRITRTATAELISEGFCNSLQKLMWSAGLEVYDDFPPSPHMKQGLEIILDFESLKQSTEMQKFFAAYSAEEGMSHALGQCDGINLTAVIIDERNHIARCLFQQDHLVERTLQSIVPGFGSFRGWRSCDFPCQPRWGLDSMQLGPSISSDVYYLGFSFGLKVTELRNGSPYILPVLEVFVEQDRSAYERAFEQAIRAQDFASLFG